MALSFIYFVLQIKRSTCTNTIAPSLQGEQLFIAMTIIWVKKLSAIPILIINGHGHVVKV